MKTIYTYKCWNSSCPNNTKEQRIKKEDLIKIEMGVGHIDYVCPNCERVIICKSKVSVHNQNNFVRGYKNKNGFSQS
jgi:predicted RNA-binding Zn-ribbon protein involved in translation (DUF1610 family)